jgi:hypothetical protein
MISDEMFKKLCELELIPTFRKPTFEELWAMLPLCINVNNIPYFLQLEKLYSCEVISYYNSFLELDEQRLIKTFNDACTKSLSDLAAEMLIELKNRGMI